MTNSEDRLRDLASLPEKAGNDYYRISQALDEMRAPFSAEFITLLADVVECARSIDEYGGLNSLGLSYGLHDKLAAIDEHTKEKP